MNDNTFEHWTDCIRPGEPRGFCADWHGSRAWWATHPRAEGQASADALADLRDAFRRAAA